MSRFFVTVVLSSVAFAQQSPDIAVAAKSPLSLVRYVESHQAIDWDDLRSALRLKDPDWFAPCGGGATANDGRCSAELLLTANANQAIVVIQDEGLGSYTVEYLRYLLNAAGDWRFAGEFSANKRFGPSHHELTTLGTKPFLKIASDHSQNGMYIGQEVEDWFDLTLPDFEPVFSFTSEGGCRDPVSILSRLIRAHSSFSEAPGGVERIDTALDVTLAGAYHSDGSPGLDIQGSYFGIYERRMGERKFSLRAAYSDRERRTRMPLKDFAILGDPFANANSTTLALYAFPGLEKIVRGSNQEDRQWLRQFLEYVEDTPQKRMLLRLLKKRT